MARPKSASSNDQKPGRLLNEVKMARPTGFEPVTVRLEGGCSIQLSYGRLPV